MCDTITNCIGTVRYCIDEKEHIPTIVDWDALFSFMKEQALFLITDDVYFDIDSTVPRSPVKYVDAWRYLTGRPNY